MIERNLDREKAALHLRPTRALRKEDFDNLAAIVDPSIEKSGGLV